MNKSFFIAEIGVNHEGSLEKALAMIDMCKIGGADCVKFQTYKAERLALKNSPSYWDTNSEPTHSQFELFKKYDCFDLEDYECLKAHCDKVEIEFLTTPFDDVSVREMDKLVRRFKVASADINNTPLLRSIGATGKPVILSTGASEKSEILEAIEILEQSGSGKISILHCVLNYPTLYNQAYMAMMRDLIESFPDYEVGYSDHTLPIFPYPALLQALMVGGTIIEKHFTFDKTLPGNDHYHAFDVNDLKKFRELENNFIEVWGDLTKKSPTPYEGEAILNARRSIVSARAINKGEIISEDDLIMKRPGRGIPPTDLHKVVGKVAVCNIESDILLDWKHIL